MGSDFVDQPSVTNDGKAIGLSADPVPGRCVHCRILSAKGPRLGTPRRLTLDEANDLPFDWASDDKKVLFTSNRAGTPSIFQQSITGTSPTWLFSAPGRRQFLVHSRRLPNSLFGAK